MINAFENQGIKTNELPEQWREEGVINDLERFLQRNWELRTSLYTDKELTKVQQFIDFDKRNGFKTRNYIGTIYFHGEQLNIFPKIFKEDEEDRDASCLKTDDMMTDLVMWLEYCSKFNFPFVSLNSDTDDVDSLLELMITVYVRYVKSEIDRQPFFKYEEIEEEGSSVRGKIDFKDYVTRRFTIGQAHMMRYSFSSFEYNNLLNQIIKYTCKLLKGLTSHSSNQKIIHDILMRLGDVSDRKCQPFDCDTIKLNSLQARYATILSLSKMFLLNEMSTEKIGIMDSFCFLFPTEDLFEGFIAGYIKETLGKDAKVTAQSRKLYLTELVVDGEVMGNRFQLKEDIVVEYKDTIVILDTKYKEIERLSRIKTDSKKLDISDDDMHQMAIYANRRGAKKIYLLYPLYRGCNPDTTEVIFNILDGPGDNARKVPAQVLQVPFSLCDNVNDAKNTLSKIFKRILE